MAKIILIHGIAAEDSSADSLMETWRPALAGGVANAGDGDLSQQIFDNKITVAMAFYGDLFTPEATLDPAAVSGYTESLSKTIVERAANPPAADPGRLANPDTLRADQAVNAPAPQPAGSRSDDSSGREGLEGTFLEKLDNMPWIKEKIFGIVEDAFVPALKQVGIYMTNPELRSKIQAIVGNAVTPDTKIIIGHSLGSMLPSTSSQKSSRSATRLCRS